VWPRTARRDHDPVEDWPPVYVSSGDLVDAGLELCGCEARTEHCP
jgi:hypothetical protein